MGAGTRHRYLAVLATAACAAGALGAGGCGSSSVSHAVNSAKSAVDPVAQAATASTAQQGVKMSMTMKMSGAGLGTSAPVTMTGAGAFSTTNQTGQFTMSMDLSSIPGASSVLGSSGNGSLSFEELTKGTTVYMKFPSAFQSLLGGLGGGSSKPWMKFDASKLLGSGSGLSSMLGGSGTSNPTQMLQALKGVAGNVQRVGTATVGGVPTTEYRSSISFAKLVQRMKQEAPALASEVTSELKSMTGGGSIPVNVWIDSSHLVRQMSMTYSGGSSVSADMTMTFSDYGPQAAPTFPPASQVSDGSALLNAASSISSSATSSSPTS